MKILGLIPARGGSKGILNKNIAAVGGKPLIAYTIEAAWQSAHLDKIVVSSDSPAVLEVAKEWRVQPAERPSELAQDDSKFEDLIFHTLDWLKEKEGYCPDIFVYLQPTSPLRTADDIDKAVEMLLDSRAKAVISVRPIDRECLKTFLLNSQGYLFGAVNNSFPFMNRQKLPEVFLPNGAVYAIRTEEFYLRRSLFSPDQTLPYVMPEERSLDINTREDLLKLEKALPK